MSSIMSMSVLIQSLNPGGEVSRHVDSSRPVGGRQPVQTVVILVEVETKTSPVVRLRDTVRGGV